MGSSLEDVRAFPVAARRAAGFQLGKLQHGQDPDDWKSMASIGVGVREIRIRESSGAYRIIYLASRAEAVYVLHAFSKKTAKTSQRDLRVAKNRLRSLPR
jgi:phage-related protein